MFGLFNKVFGLSPSKIGQSLKESLLGEYEGVVELAQDIGGDITETATSWGKSLGLIEDPKSDYDLLVEQARDRMDPIIDKYTKDIDGSKAPERAPSPDVYDGDSWDGDYDEPEFKQPDPVRPVQEAPEIPMEVELMEMNSGEQAISNSLSGLLHDLKSTEGKIGTETYSLQTEEGLQNMLQVLKDESWEEEMANVPVDEALQAKLLAQRSTTH